MIQEIVKEIGSSFSDSDVKRIVSQAIVNEVNKLVTLEAIIDALKPHYIDGSNWRISAVESLIYANGGAKVGMGATMHGYTDKQAYTVVKVNKTGKTLVLQRDKAELDASFKPEWIPGGFAGHVTNNNAQTYNYTPDLEGNTVTVRLHKDGHFYTAGGSHVTIGYRMEFHDYNF